MILRPPPTTSEPNEIRDWAEDLYHFLQAPYNDGYNSNNQIIIAPEMWQAKGDGIADDSTAMQAAIDAYKALLASYVTSSYRYDSWFGPVFTLRPGAIYKCSTALYGGGSLTSCLKWVQGNGAVIIGADEDEPVIDMTGALGCVWRDFVIEGDPTTPPDMGIFLSRPASGASAGNHFFGNTKVVGSFKYAPVYNYGSEMNVWLNCKFLNYAGQAGVILGDGNARAFDPTGGQAIASGSQSAIGQFFYNCTIYNHDVTTGALSNYSGLEIDGFNKVKFDGLIDANWTDVFSHGGTAPNKPCVLLRSTTSSPNQIDLSGTIFHAVYPSAIEVEANTTVTNLLVKGGHWGSDANNPANSSYQLKLNASSVLRGSELDIPNVLASASGASILESKVNLASCKPGDWADGSDLHTFTLSGNFSGELIARSTDLLTLTSVDSYNGTLFLVNTGMRHYWGHGIGNTAKNNAPGTGNINLAVTDVINGFILDDPEGNATWTFPTATALIAGMPNCRQGARFYTFLSNQATAGSGEKVTLAENTGVTLASMQISENIVLTEGINRGCWIEWRVDAIDTPAITGLVFFSGIGIEGLARGACYGDDISWTVAAGQNTWYEIADVSITDGLLNNVTHDGNGKLTITQPGIFSAFYSLSAEASAANVHFETSFSINGTETGPRKHYETKAISKEFPACDSWDFDLADNATIEVSVRTTDAGTPTIAVDHFTLKLNQVART